MRRMIAVMCLFVVALSSASACDLKGTWKGPVHFTKFFAQYGTRTLTLKVDANCKYTFVSPGVVNTVGSASKGLAGKKFSYRNAAGSVGSMEIVTQKGKQQLKIIQFQGNYTAQLARVGR